MLRFFCLILPFSSTCPMHAPYTRPRILSQPVVPLERDIQTCRHHLLPTPDVHASVDPPSLDLRQTPHPTSPSDYPIHTPCRDAPSVAEYTWRTSIGQSSHFPSHSIVFPSTYTSHYVIPSTSSPHIHTCRLRGTFLSSPFHLIT